MKCATVAIIGRPSAGKSTLVNTICEGKVSIVSTTPQTTRNAIKGIYTDSRGQLIFIDTPGYHHSEAALNQKLQQTTRSSLQDCDLLLYMVDPTRSAGIEEQSVVDLIKQTNTPTVVAINKTDVATADEIASARLFITEQLAEVPVFELSAQKDEGVDELLIELYALAPEGKLLYPKDTYTDQPLEFRIAEIIREKTISSLTEELPHSVYVEVADLEYAAEAESIWVRAFIHVERDSQKGIVVGKGGEGIKKIRQASFKEIRRLFPGKSLHVDLRVKTLANWRKNESLLQSLF